MSEPIPSGETQTAGEGALQRMLGLGEDEVEALGAIFAEATGAMGIDGAPIFERIKQGQSLGQALAMPKGAGDLLYARAHRWFSLGRIDKAEPLFRALCILDGATADYWIGYGVCLRLRGFLSQAEIAFETAARLRTDWAIPHFHALELAVHRDDWPNAAQRLGRFEERVTAETPEAVQAEAERLRAAIDLRRGSGHIRSSP